MMKLNEYKKKNQDIEKELRAANDHIQLLTQIDEEKKNRIEYFRTEMLRELRTHDTEFKLIKNNIQIEVDSQEDTKIRFHNLTNRLDKLEEHSGVHSCPKINLVRSKAPLRQDTIEKTGLKYYDWSSHT